MDQVTMEDVALIATDFRHFYGCPEVRPDGTNCMEAYTLDVPPDQRKNWSGHAVATVVRCVQCGSQAEKAGDHLQAAREAFAIDAKHPARKGL